MSLLLPKSQSFFWDIIDPAPSNIVALLVDKGGVVSVFESLKAEKISATEFNALALFSC